MEPKPRPEDPQTVSCEICLKEIPRSEALNAEAVEYVAHFCGLDCYDVWKVDAARSGPLSVVED